MRRFVSLVALTLLLICSVSNLSASGAGRESVFSIGVGGRALAMGGGFTSLADDATSVYYNPAGLGLLEYQELTFMHIELFEGTNFNFGSWVYPLNPKFGFGIGYMRIGTEDLIKMQNFVSLGTFTYSQSQVLISAGARPTDKIAIGATIKGANQEIDNVSDWAAGLDAGVIIIPHKYVRIGLAARDAITPNLKLKTTPEKTPKSASGGVAVTAVPLSERTKFSASVELEKFEDRSAKIHTGGELIFDDAYAVRAGYDRDNIAMGVGYSYQSFSVDYGYKILDQIDNSHRISLSLKLGEAAEPSQGQEQEIESSSSAKAGDVPYEFTRQFIFYKTLADDCYDQSKLDSALMYYRRALDFDRGSEEIKMKISMIATALRMERRKEVREPLKLTMPIPKESATDNERIIELYLNQSRSFNDEGYYYPALELLEQILILNPRHKEAMELSIRISREIEQRIENLLGEAWAAERAGEFSEAIASYTRVLEFNPSLQKVRIDRELLFRKLSVSDKLILGIKQFEEGKFGTAKTIFEAVLTIDPANDLAKNYLQKIAKPPLEPLVTSEPTPLEVIQADSAVWPFYLEGLKFMRDKEYQKAIDTWAQVLKAYPNSPHTANNIVQARLRLEAKKEK